VNATVGSTGLARGAQPVTEQEIADFLARTPAFFERHAELLAGVRITSPHGHRAVSLQERQMEMLRERIKGLEMKLMEMIRHGQENLTIGERLHQWARRILLTTDAAALPQAMVEELQHRFLVPQAAIRVWGVAPQFAGQPFASGVSADVQALAAGMDAPYCGAKGAFEPAGWLAAPQEVQSLAMVPLRHEGETFGLLVLASPDPTRYSAEMGTEFLERIGDLAGAALSRLRAGTA
jgi:uncharacterized protein YigA (DUF484 family)